MMKYYPTVMKRRTNARVPQLEPENVGCIPGIFRMFDFQRSPRLISDLNYTVKHAVVDVNAKSKTRGRIHEGVDNVNKNTKGGRPGMQCVKTLMEEEMAKLIPASMIPSENFQRKTSENKTEIRLEKKLNQEQKKPNELMSPQSPESFDFSNQIDCYNLGSLSEFSDPEVYAKKKAESNCKLRDPNSLILECLGRLDQSEGLYKTEPIGKWSRNHSFRKREKSKTNQGFSRIVILKPSLSRTSSPLEGIDSERGLHHYSLTEIKSRLRQTIIDSRKERDLISIAADDLHNANEGDSVETGERKIELNGEEAKSKVEYFSYGKAKMHLMERLDSLGKNDFRTGRQSRSLSSLLSFPDFDSLSSPICTPRKEDDVNLFVEGSNLTYLDPLEEENNADILNLLIGHQGTEDGFKLTAEELDILGDGIQSERANLGECLDLLKTGQEEEPESLQLSEEDDSSNSYERSIDVPVQPSIPEVLESTGTSEEKTEESSPAFLHDEVVSDDTVKFASRTTKHEELPIQRTIVRFKELNISSFLNPTYETLILDDKEAKSEFVRVVVKTSGLCKGDSERWSADDSLLDPFLYDEIGISYDYSNDSKYLFDLIEEVLNELRDKFLVPATWVWSIYKKVRPMPVGEDLVQEVCKGVDLHLKHKFPCTLDQIVAKDLEYRSWMDTRPDIEVIILEIGDDMLDDLLEEAVFDLWFP